MTDLRFWGLFVVYFVAGMLFGRLVVRPAQERIFRQEAIEAGVAEYVITDSYGNTEFRFITCEQK